MPDFNENKPKDECDLHTTQSYFFNRITTYTTKNDEEGRSSAQWYKSVVQRRDFGHPDKKKARKDNTHHASRWQQPQRRVAAFPPPTYDILITPLISSPLIPTGPTHTTRVTRVTRATHVLERFQR